ncbi:MAG: hypothetical protein IKV35_06150, partial [Clostridia bacterium]|nr:hypothetical protein [Clostridia bacterium]
MALIVTNDAKLTAYPYWDGVVQSSIPFDIVFQDKTYNKWIYASANFCYEFEGNNGASQPLPAGRHEELILVSSAYTWNGDALPSDAAIRSITFIAHAAGTIRVERCAMTDGGELAALVPDDVYQIDRTMIKAIPLSQTVADFCGNVRLQFDAFRTTVKKQNGTAAKETDFVGTGDVITVQNGSQTQTYTAVVRGDLDASGTATTSDVRWLLCGCMDESFFTDAQRAAADILTDRTVNTTDARLLLKDALMSPSMQFAQESVVSSETFLSQSKYDTFLSSATRDTLMAGLSKDLVPQGLAQSHKTGLLYMSAYSSSGGGSVVLVYDANGRFRAEYAIYNRDGSACTAHLGGVAVTDTTLFLSYDGDGAYRVAALPIADLVTSGSQKVVLGTLYEVPVATSFLSYYDGYLWMGNFYLPSGGYDLMRTLNFTTGSENYGCYIAGFDLSKLGNDRLAPASGASYPTPDVLMAAPQKVQGVAFDTKTGTMILSHSWGRKNDSSLAFYSVNLSAKGDTTITINGTAVKCFILNSPKKTVTTLP